MLRFFFTFDCVDKPAHSYDDSGLILSQRDFEKRLALANGDANYRIIQLYFRVKYLYHRYADYERCWLLHRLENAGHLQLQRLDNLLMLLTDILKRNGRQCNYNKAFIS